VPVRSELNKQTLLAGPGEFPPLRLGGMSIDPPVVLAPMAGVTNAAFRTLCRQFSDQRCLYVSEMIVARSFVMGHARTLRLASFGADEEAGGGMKSIQLYGTDPQSLAVATRILVTDWGVHHIDLNFGCPVRKVTAAGGGSAIPLRPRLMARLVGAVVKGAAEGSVPVTVKFRKGIDDHLPTFLDAGRVAEAEGAAAVGLHARTAAQLYSGEADWAAIAELKSAVGIPVLGNGDVFEAFDALRMMRQTGCDGVIVGRGCLGRPWLFRDLVDVFAGREPQEPPCLGEVCDIALAHARLLAAFLGERGGMLQMRKHMSWYTKSFAGMGKVRPALMRVATLAELAEMLSRLERELPFPVAGLRVKRGKDSRSQKVSLPPGFLDHRDDDSACFEDPTEMNSALSGG
jgi:nifR3 family TIM-barrel protein